MRSPQHTEVLILGAGYAGVHAARTARRAGATVTVVDPTGQHDLAPRLAAVAAGRRPAGDAWAPLDALVDATLVRARAVAIDIDIDIPTVSLDDGRVLHAGAIVVTVGAGPKLPPVPGLDPTTAWSLRNAADALRLRTALPEADRLVVVGAGSTGVQLAAETASQHPHIDVHLVEAGDRVLGQFDAPLGRGAARVLRDRGVTVHLATSVDRADGDGVILSDGTRLDGVVVWATGVAADGHALLPDAPTSDGRLLVDRALRVGGRVLAAGDIAAHRDLLGRVTPPSAQIALQAGRAAGRNAAAIADGRMPRAASLLGLGWIVDLGGQGVAQLGPFDVTAPLVDRVIPVLHEAIDLRHLWQAGGANAVVEHATGKHDPTDAQIRRTERPSLRSVS
ncbi:MAG: NADH dehydrogenase [Myxococcota bacterium]|jgi:NADH dehydrogenase